MLTYLLVLLVVALLLLGRGLSGRRRLLLVAVRLSGHRRLAVALAVPRVLTVTTVVVLVVARLVVAALTVALAVALEIE